MAALHGKLQVFKYFITERNCNPACLGQLRLTPLHLASEQGHLDVVELLAAEIVKYNPMTQVISEFTNKWQSTPLYSAAMNGHSNIVNL